jgi:hypothetical protein
MPEGCTLVKIYETLAGDLTNPQVQARFLIAVLPLTGSLAPGKTLVDAMPEEILWLPISDVYQRREGDTSTIVFDADGRPFEVGAWYPIVLGEVAE